MPEARAAITAVEETLEQAATGYLCRRAFTSPTIRRILAGRGEEVPSLAQALDSLREAGVERVAVQPTHLLYGYEYDKLKAEAEAAALPELALGRPLMLVAGDHARADMAEEWKPRLEQAGHTASCVFTGLGELPWVQEMYRERLLQLLHMEQAVD